MCFPRSEGVQRGDPGRQGHLAGGKKGPLRVRGLGRLDDGSGSAGQGHGGHAVHLAGDPRPRVAGRLLGDTDEEQGEPADDDMRADAGLEPVEHRPEHEGGQHAPEAALGARRFL